MKVSYLIRMPKVIHGHRTSRIEVNNLSSILQRKAVETVELYFQREFRYQFIQYEADSKDSSIAFLLTESQSYKDISNNR